MLVEGSGRAAYANHLGLVFFGARIAARERHAGTVGAVLERAEISLQLGHRGCGHAAMMRGTGKRPVKGSSRGGRPQLMSLACHKTTPWFPGQSQRTHP